MAINRYMKPAQNARLTYMNTYAPLPFQEMLMGTQAKQKQQDENKNQIAQAQARLAELKNIREHDAYANYLQTNFNNEMTTLLNENPDTTSAEFARKKRNAFNKYINDPNLKKLERSISAKDAYEKEVARLKAAGQYGAWNDPYKDQIGKNLSTGQRDSQGNLIGDPTGVTEFVFDSGIEKAHDHSKPVVALLNKVKSNAIASGDIKLDEATGLYKITNTKDEHIMRKRLYEKVDQYREEFLDTQEGMDWKRKYFYDHRAENEAWEKAFRSDMAKDNPKLTEDELDSLVSQKSKARMDEEATKYLHSIAEFYEWQKKDSKVSAMYPPSLKGDGKGGGTNGDDYKKTSTSMHWGTTKLAPTVNQEIDNWDKVFLSENTIQTGEHLRQEYIDTNATIKSKEKLLAQYTDPTTGKFIKGKGDAIASETDYKQIQQEVEALKAKNAMSLQRWDNALEKTWQKVGNDVKKAGYTRDMFNLDVANIDSDKFKESGINHLRNLDEKKRGQTVDNMEMAYIDMMGDKLGLTYQERLGLTGSKVQEDLNKAYDVLMLVHGNSDERKKAFKEMKDVHHDLFSMYIKYSDDKANKLMENRDLRAALKSSYRQSYGLADLADNAGLTASKPGRYNDDLNKEITADINSKTMATVTPSAGTQLYNAMDYASAFSGAGKTSGDKNVKGGAISYETIYSSADIKDPLEWKGTMDKTELQQQGVTFFNGKAYMYETVQGFIGGKSQKMHTFIYRPTTTDFASGENMAALALEETIKAKFHEQGGNLPAIMKQDKFRKAIIDIYGGKSPDGYNFNSGEAIELKAAVDNYANVMYADKVNKLVKNNTTTKFKLRNKKEVEVRMLKSQSGNYEPVYQLRAKGEDWNTVTELNRESLNMWLTLIGESPVGSGGPSSTATP